MGKSRSGSGGQAVLLSVILGIIASCASISEPADDRRPVPSEPEAPVQSRSEPPPQSKVADEPPDYPLPRQPSQSTADHASFADVELPIASLPGFDESAFAFPSGEIAPRRPSSPVQGNATRLAVDHPQRDIPEDAELPGWGVDPTWPPVWPVIRAGALPSAPAAAERAAAERAAVEQAAVERLAERRTAAREQAAGRAAEAPTVPERPGKDVPETNAPAAASDQPGNPLGESDRFTRLDGESSTPFERETEPAAERRESPESPESIEAQDPPSTVSRQPPAISRAPSTVSQAPSAESTPAPLQRADDEGAQAEEARDQTDEKAVGVSSTPDELRVVLPGAGWVYLGEENSGDLEFLRKDIDQDGSTRFVFRNPQLGDYTLVFQKQDLSSGVLDEQRVTVSPGDLQPARTVEIPAPVQSEGSTPGEQVSTEGYAADRQSDDSQLPGQSAGEPAETMTALEVPESIEAAVAAAEQAAAAQRFGAAIDLLEAFVARQEQSRGLDEVYFRLGRLYEAPSDRRDMGRARGYYRHVVDGYPFSMLREDAEARVRYITRHFFQIR